MQDLPHQVSPYFCLANIAGVIGFNIETSFRNLLAQWKSSLPHAEELQRVLPGGVRF